MHINRSDLETLESILFPLAQRDERAAEGLTILHAIRDNNATDEQLDLAREEWAGRLEDINIDDDAGTSPVDGDGFWIGAWLWVPEQEDENG